MKVLSVQQAVAMIPDGARLMIGGFMGVGTPERLVLGPTFTVAAPMLPAPVAKAPSGPPLSRSPPHLG